MLDTTNDAALPVGARVRCWDGSTGAVTGHEPGWVHVADDRDGKVWAYAPHQVRRLAVLTRYWTIDVIDGEPPRVRIEYTLGDVVHVAIAEATNDGRDFGNRALDGDIPSELSHLVTEALVLRGTRPGFAGRERGEQARAAFESHYDRDLGPDPELAIEHDWTSRHGFETEEDRLAGSLPR